MFLNLLNILKDMLFFTGSYSNSIFPEPLSMEEEEKCINKMLAGDKDARNKLIEHNLRLVAHIVKKFDSKDNTDDLISIGTIGLIKGIDSYKNNKQTRITTYAARCIDTELLMLLRSKKKSSKEVSLYEPIGTDKEGNEISLLDVIETEPVDVVKNYSLKQEIAYLYQLLPKILSSRAQEIVILRYGLYGKEELPQREIAKRLKISRSYVSRIEKNALLKLREYF